MDLTIKQRRLKFLEKGVAYYAADPVNRRAVNSNGRCRYRTEDGKKCFIGRYIPESKYSSGLEGLAACAVLIKEVLPKCVSSLGDQFLRDVQVLHDRNNNWNSTGLSEIGKQNYLEIVDAYC